MACTYEDAFRLLLKESPNFEKVLYDRLKDSARIVESEITRNQSGQLLDKHGNPVPDSPSN
jgi:hypothetical protein